MFIKLHWLLDKEILLGNPQSQEPTSKTKLYIYFGIFIYMGIITESCVKNYWDNCIENGTSYIIKNYIKKNQFQ